MIIDFFNTSAKLKRVPRQGWIDKLSLNNPESVADHTFSMAIIGMIFSDLEGFDTEKILKIILLHDLAESLIGDIIPGQISKEQKIELENNAMKKIFSNLPDMLHKKYNDLWIEYQSHQSKESEIVHQIDKLEMALQAKIHLKDGHSKDKLDSFFSTARNEVTNPKLSELLEGILEK